MLSLTRWFFIMVISILSSTLGIASISITFTCIWSFLLAFGGMIIFAKMARDKFLASTQTQKIARVIFAVFSPVLLLSLALTAIWGISELLNVEFTLCFLAITFWACLTKAIKN